MGNAGRPKGDNNKDYNYTFRMDSLTRIRLEKYCEKMQIQKSEAIRKAIDFLTDDNEVGDGKNGN